MNSHRSISPAPSRTLAKPLSSASFLSDSSFNLGTTGQHTARRTLTLQQKKVLKQQTIDVRDIDLVKDFMETYQGSLKVAFLL
jgi:hypothetical protein